MNPVLVARVKSTSSAVAEQVLVAVNLSAPQDVLDVPGIKLGSAATGLKASDDIVVAHLDPQARVAGVYTQSSFAAAPVLLARDRQEDCQEGAEKKEIQEKLPAQQHFSYCVRQNN